MRARSPRRARAPASPLGRPISRNSARLRALAAEPEALLEEAGRFRERSAARREAPEEGERLRDLARVAEPASRRERVEEERARPLVLARVHERDRERAHRARRAARI